MPPDCALIGYSNSRQCTTRLGRKFRVESTVITESIKTMRKIRIYKTLKRFAILISLCFAVVNPGFSNTPQTHDVPAFHNDDGLGLLQDCTFMKARATGSITSDVPTTVAGRAVGCLTSIKSVAQLLFSLQNSESLSTSCLPSAELDWLAVLDFIIDYMEKQPKKSLSTKPYGVWIDDSLREKFPCK